MVGSTQNSEFAQAVIWGTTVNVQRSMRNFQRFIEEFTLKHRRTFERQKRQAGGGSGGSDTGGAGGGSGDVGASGEGAVDDESDDGAHYLRLLHEIEESQVFNLNIDCQDLFCFEPTRKLYLQLIRYPQEMIPIMDLVVDQVFKRQFGEGSLHDHRIQVRTFNLRECHPVRDLDPTDIDQMIAIRGMVLRCSPVIPDLKQAFFRCMVCRYAVEVLIDRGKIHEPQSCDHCSAKYSMELVHNRCMFADKQLVKLQETPESIPEGETPHTMTLFAFDDLVDVARPGDRVEVTGVYRAIPRRVNPKNRSLRSVYSTHIDVLHFRKMEKGRISAEDAAAKEGSEFYTRFDETTAVGAQQERCRHRVAAMSKDPRIYDKLAQSLAPSIWGLMDVKKGLLCQLFGGTNKFVKKGHGDVADRVVLGDGGGGGHTGVVGAASGGNNKPLARGEINILLCGDPGTSKSQLLGYVNKISPRGLYTSGKGSSAVGLTAYVTKDPMTKELVLESGALVLSDRGVCCIDEFDKMNDSTRSVLHEAMEQQTISVAKAGIICTLNARTAVLASANPVESRYNPRLSVVQNIQLPPTLVRHCGLRFLYSARGIPPFYGCPMGILRVAC